MRLLRNRHVGLWLTLCLSVATMAQESDSELLKDSIIELSFSQLNRLELRAAAEKFTVTNKSIDPIIAEALIYAEAKKTLGWVVDDMAVAFTIDQLRAIVAFMNSEAFSRLSSYEVSEALDALLIADIKRGFAFGASWNPNIPSLHSRKYDAIADKYLALVGNVTLPDDRIQSLVERVGNETGINDENTIAAVAKLISKDYSNYYKNVLVDYVTMEQLQAAVDFYSQPYMTVIKEVIANPARLLLENEVKNIHAFENKVKGSYGNFIRIKDTSSVVRDYIARLPYIPIWHDYVPNRPIQTVAMKSKGTYTGQTRDGQAHGRGVLVDKDGVRYSGSFKKGKRHGLITTYLPTADSITQVWAADQVMDEQNADIEKPVPLYKEYPMGYGFKATGRDREEGMFVDGALQGYARRTISGGNTIEEGLFDGGLMTKGRVTSGNAGNALVIFDGEQSYSVLHGKIRNGKVTVRTQRGNESVVVVEKGVFVDYELCGKGTMTLSKGTYKQGEEGYFNRGMLYGKGVKRSSSVSDENWNCNQAISGYFFQGVLSGEMLYEEQITNISNASGDNAMVTFTRFGLELSCQIPPQSSKSVSKGSLTLRIKCAVINEKLNGRGEVTLSSGDYYKGEFMNGYFLDGTARITNKDGSIYEGELVSGRYEGEGKLTHADGSWEEGTFMFGSFVSGMRRDKRGEVHDDQLQRLY